jgi:hypothetical protein
MISVAASKTQPVPLIFDDLPVMPTQHRQQNRRPSFTWMESGLHCKSQNKQTNIKNHRFLAPPVPTEHQQKANDRRIVRLVVAEQKRAHATYRKTITTHTYRARTTRW